MHLFIFSQRLQTEKIPGLLEFAFQSRVLVIHPSLIAQCLEYGEALSPASPDEQPVLRLQEGDHPRVALHRRLLPRQAQALLSMKQC